MRDAMTERVNSLSLAEVAMPQRPAAFAQHALSINAAAIAMLASRIGEGFDRAVEILLGCKGRVVISGIGKSGLVGRKVAATMSSLGTPALFVHSADAAHGDLGMITSGDVCVLISAGGETREVNALLPYLKRIEVPVIALTGDESSTLARHSDVVLDCSIEREACPHNLAPTTSTLVAMALGDALGIALGAARGFRPNDFARFHPGGRLGQRLSTVVRDTMHRDNLPICAPDTPVPAMVKVMSGGRLGLVLVMNGATLEGIVTDGDVRRGLESVESFVHQVASDVMTRDPLTIEPEANLFDADERLRAAKVTALVVTDASRKVLGVFQIHD